MAFLSCSRACTEELNDAFQVMWVLYNVVLFFFFLKAVVVVVHVVVGLFDV